ncbi:putative disease resistance RPP13-like protein 1 [Tripterygium wilfordii]|uniref:putative disease resistance RPP13-like protein 1 n=1 Tax=Tripterygium wilfordii TaxID=458696 RepID=UPI0018F7EB65|nr:putative disease resistance RPP13-like protein 1 [Tripterygium wilfordii]
MSTTSSSVMEVTKSIIESATKASVTLSTLDAVQRRLSEVVENKKIFLVLDDMWVENHNYWDELKLPFAYAGTESKILVTTQSTMVSSIVATTGAYNLAPLSDEECWEIIMQKALSSRNLCGMENLEGIGKEIAKKCYGVPLVAKILGCVLRQRLKEKQWHEVLEGEIWELAQVKTEVFPTLKLGFDRLSPHLRRCFLYCSIFHSNYEFQKDNLVQMWVAEGLVVQEKRRAIWEVGKDYFDDLLGRSFFYASDLVGYRQQYKMHGLLHKLAELISSDLCFRVEDTSMEMKLLGKHRGARHSSLTCSDFFQPLSLEPFRRFKRLRTFMSDGLEGEMVDSGFFKKLKRLRTLHFRGLDMRFIPDAIEHLIHLRYLDASYSKIVELPRGIANIIGLQTIKLRGCKNLRRLPKNMKKLIELQHLELGSDTQFMFMPPEFEKLKQLETFDVFVVGDKQGSSIAELENLNNIKGDLSIIGLENVSKKEEAETAKLSGKLHLENLQLRWNQESDSQLQLEVLNSLQPHMGLKRLTIENYGHLGFSNWLADPLFSTLIELMLKDCRNCAYLPLLGQLPALEILLISGMHELVEIDSTFCGFGGSRGFMSLKSLELNDMPKLERWEGLQSTYMPFLLKLVIEGCPLLKVLPLLQSLSSLETLKFAGCTHLQSLPEGPLPNTVKYFEIKQCDLLKESCSEDGSDWMKIRHIPRIVIDGQLKRDV